MRPLFTVLTIALVAQVSFAASIPRPKRETEDIFEALKEIVEEEREMVEAVLKDMPKSEAYAKYRKNWETFMEVYNYKGDDLLCLVKVQGLMEEFGDIVGNYKAPDAPAEAKEILKLFNEHGLPAHIESVKIKVSKMKDLDESKIFDNC